jgi:hypothetical protein
LADGPARSAFIAAVAVAGLSGTVRRTGTSVGSLTTSPPPNGSSSRKYARTIVVAGAGVSDGEGGAIVGLGVAGLSVGIGVGAGVAATDGDGDGDAVGEGRLAEGGPETAGLGLAPGAAQPATRAMIRSAATD